MNNRQTEGTSPSARLKYLQMARKSGKAGVAKVNRTHWRTAFMSHRIPHTSFLPVSNDVKMSSNQASRLRRE